MHSHWNDKTSVFSVKKIIMCLRKYLQRKHVALCVGRQQGEQSRAALNQGKL
jgi:hypothetical protein